LPEIEVEPLRLARVELPDFHPEAPGSDTIHGFLVRDGRDCVLVDTGVGTGNRLIDRLYQPERVELSAALSTVGTSIDQVTAVVNSHLHFDHCGNNSLFPGVPIFVQEAELEAAKQPAYTVPEWVRFPGASYTPVRGRHSISAHLELLPTPGHTPGHQSLLVRSAGHVEIIVAQAAYTAAEFQLFMTDDTDGAPGSPALQACIRSNATWSPEHYAASLAAIRKLRPRRAFFSHDPVVWERPVEQR
jgi:N-acyl homoserine lactone hydrolase